MVKIAVVNSNSFGNTFPEHWKRLKKLGAPRRFQVPSTISGPRLAKLLKGYSCVIASVNPQFGAKFFEAMRGQLRLLARHGIGLNNVDVEAAKRCGVRVTKVAGAVEREAVAEHALALVLACLRKLKPADAAVRQGAWLSRADFVGGELRGRKMGFVGFGNIGSRLGAMLQRGFGAKVLACDPKKGGSSLATLYKEASVISLNCSLTPTNRAFLNARALKRCQPGVIIVNTARGELIDEGAMAAALKSGHVAAYGTDVLSGEPEIKASRPLLK